MEKQTSPRKSQSWMLCSGCQRKLPIWNAPESKAPRLREVLRLEEQMPLELLEQTVEEAGEVNKD